ncbi:MAG: cytochrome c biogenesis protein CcsA [Pirellulaceae bacterium]|nr:cytochrome c biogenesis protein CcsA [Pirellulaceae bacterium]
MSSEAIVNPATRATANQASDIDISKILWQVVKMFGSLRITVWGFFFAIVVIFVGTLAQDESTIVDVKKEYFNAWITHIPLDVFKPITIWPLDQYPRLPYSIPFPGGATIGLVLLINLIAAKLTRFHLTAKGAKFVAGLAFCLVGATITAVVILGAHAEDGLQGEPPFSYDLLWQICRFTIWGSALACGLWFLFGKTKTTLAYWTLFVVVILLGLWSFAWLFYADALRIPDPGLRIVWQMSKSLIAGTILLVGLTLLFGIRGGNVLIHLAVGMMMLGQFIFGDRQIEERITLGDGQTTNVAIRPDEIELAFIDSSDPTKDSVVAIDGRLLLQSYRSQKPISDPALPVSFVVKQYMENSDLRRVTGADKTNLASVGEGLQWIAEPTEKFGGAVEKRENNQSAYVEITDRESHKVIGTYLLVSLFNDNSAKSLGMRPDLLEDFQVNGKTISMGLRNRRTYKDYNVNLKEAQRVNYSGTQMVRDYSSFVHFSDSSDKDILDARIWMNNPVRYRGETFYQSGFYPAGSEIFEGQKLPRDTTVLQVVTNAGWLMPYIACAFAGLGMLAHFGGTFLRFASRFDRERRLVESKSAESSKLPSKSDRAKPAASAVDSGAVSAVGVNTANEIDLWSEARASRRGTSGWLLPLIVVGLVGGMFAYYAKPKVVSPGEFDWYAAGQLPMQHEGRIKPFDTVARNVLQALSGSTSTLVRGEDDPSKVDTKYSATQWYFGLIAGDTWIENAKVFRIDAKEVLDIFELSPEDSGGTLDTYAKIFRHSLRQRYSFAQLDKHMDRFREKYVPVLERLRKGESVNSLSFSEKKILELNEKLNIFSLNRFVNSIDNFPVPPKDLENQDSIKQFFDEVIEGKRMIESMREGKPAAMIPPVAIKSGKVITPDEEARSRWQALRPAKFDDIFGPLLKTENIADSRALKPLEKLIDEAGGKDGAAFNAAVGNYRDVLADLPTSKVTLEKTSFEAWYNKFGAFNGCMAFYLMAFVLTLLSFAVFPQTLRRTAFWMIAVVFVVHVIAIASRVYITERAPVISLYSSAVFIGCMAVLFGLIVEMLFPLRIGLLIGSVLGSTTLLVSWGLETSDTMPVLEAVLDTQFWLATHVQCITLGYVATFFAGFLGILAIMHRLTAIGATPRGQFSGMQAEIHRILIRLLYGTVCVAIFFSFTGTVLGGLWADDSWGRFWGWDPKENGALMIVLWNAILLHARWDKLVRDQGIALLAVGGNIMTAWSWFGTNQLGIGLHSYGFTSTVLMILAWFVLTQIIIISVGLCLVVMTKRSASPDARKLTEPTGSWE